MSDELIYEIAKWWLAFLFLLLFIFLVSGDELRGGNKEDQNE